MFHFHNAIKAASSSISACSLATMAKSFVLFSKSFFLSASRFCYLIHFLALATIMSHSSLLSLKLSSRIEMASIVRMTWVISVFDLKRLEAYVESSRNWRIIEDDEEVQKPLESWALMRLWNDGLIFFGTGYAIAIAGAEDIHIMSIGASASMPSSSSIRSSSHS